MHRAVPEAGGRPRRTETLLGMAVWVWPSPFRPAAGAAGSLAVLKSLVLFSFLLGAS